MHPLALSGLFKVRNDRFLFQFILFQPVKFPFISDCLRVSSPLVGVMKEVTKQQHAGFLSSSNFKLNCKTEFNPPHWVSKSPWFPSAWPPRNGLITHPLFLFRGSRAPEGIYWPRAKGVSAPPSIRSRPYYIFYTCKIYYRHSRKLTENGLCTGYPKGGCLMPFIALSLGGVLYRNLERERKPPSNF